MLVTTQAIVLRTIRHGDSTVVLKAWTGHAGLRSYMVRTGKRGSTAMAALQPLNRLEIVAAEHADRDMHMVRELRVARPYRRLPVDPVRGIVALFVQEVLYRALRQEAADDALNGFLEEALEALDTAQDLRFYPLVFLVRLSGYLGFFPEAPSPGEDRFDLREGHFVRGAGDHAHTLGPALSSTLAGLLSADLLDPITLEIPLTQRRELLDHLLLYYRMHLEGMGEMRSPAVLHQVLG